MTEEVSESPTTGWVRVSAYAVAHDDGRRMLLCRIASTEPGASRWTLPGGGLDFGERPEAGVLRELAEECGYTGRVTRLIGVDSIHMPPRPWRAEPVHAVRILYEVEITGGEARDEPDGSTDTCAWFTPERWTDLPRVELVDVALALLEAHA